MRGHKSLRDLHTDSRLRARRVRQCGQLVIVCGVLALGSIEIASAKDFTLLLTGDKEVPCVTTEASATGVISVADDHSISGTIHTTGIDGTVARIYVQSPGRNGRAIVTLQWIDDNTWTVPLGSRLTEVQYNYYKFGLLYVNIQSAANPTGEIRAQIQP